MQKRTLIIAGMHRSGTSLITQWLTKCGMELGERLGGASTGNVEGHFEDCEFLKMHEEILDNHKLPRSGLTVAHVDSFSIYEREKVKSIIKVKQQLYDQWGWKDPRTCMFLDVYQQLIPDACYMVIIRDYQSVISSLLRRDVKVMDKRYEGRKLLPRLAWFRFRRARKIKAFYRNHTQEYLKVWISYNQDILNCIKQLNRDAFVVVNYSMLNKADLPVFKYLQNQWDFSLKYFKFKDVFKENLMGEDLDIDPYIIDRRLVFKAKQLQDELMGYMIG
jgi:hypothetical protein